MQSRQNVVLPVLRETEHQLAALKELTEHRAAGVHVLRYLLLEVECYPGDVVRGRQINWPAVAPFELLDHGVGDC